MAPGRPRSLSPAHRQLSSALRSSAGLSAWFPVQFVGDTQHPGPEVGSGGERRKLKKQGSGQELMGQVLPRGNLPLSWA